MSSSDWLKRKDEDHYDIKGYSSEDDLEPAITPATRASKRKAGPAGGDKPKRAASTAEKSDVLGNSGMRGKHKVTNSATKLVLYESEEYSSDEEVSDEEFEMHELHGLINDATADIFEIMEDHIRQMRTEFRFRLNKMYNSITGYLMTKAKKPTKAKKRLSRIH